MSTHSVAIVPIVGFEFVDFRIGTKSTTTFDVAGIRWCSVEVNASDRVRMSTIALLSTFALVNVVAFIATRSFALGWATALAVGLFIGLILGGADDVVAISKAEKIATNELHLSDFRAIHSSKWDDFHRSLTVRPGTAGLPILPGPPPISPDAMSQLAHGRIRALAVVTVLAVAFFGLIGLAIFYFALKERAVGGILFSGVFIALSVLAIYFYRWGTARIRRTFGV